MQNDTNTEDLKRDELLKELSKITFAAFLTYLSSEYCLEVITYTSSGTSYQWIPYDDWNVYELKLCSEEKLSEIRSKIKEGSLNLADLEGTQFFNLIESTIEPEDSTNYAALLSGLLDLPLQLNNEVYCYFDSYDKTFSFFASQDALKDFLKNVYPADTFWDELDTEDLENHLDMYREEGEYVPCIYFDNES